MATKAERSTATRSLTLSQARETAQRSASDVLTTDALARVGRGREALAALDTARSLLAGQDGRIDEWMYDFDEGSLAVHAGTCLLTVGRPESAAAAFTDAMRLVPACCERRGAVQFRYGPTTPLPHNGSFSAETIMNCKVLVTGTM
jgi:hypothetical protein